MSGPSDITRQDLTQHFHLPISDAARRLNICTTVMKKICRQHGIARWPQRKVAALNKRIKALEYEMTYSTTADKKAAIAEQMRIMSEELKSIYDCTAACLLDDSEPEPFNGSKKRKQSFDGAHLSLDKMEVDSDDSHFSLMSPRYSPSASFSPRNPFPRGSPRHRLENMRNGMDNMDSEVVEESPRSEMGMSLPSLPQDDAMSMLLEAITSVESELPAPKRMRTSTGVAPLPSVAALKTAMHIDMPRASPFAPKTEMPYANFPFYDFTPRPSMPLPSIAQLPQPQQMPQQMPQQQFFYPVNQMGQQMNLGFGQQSRPFMGQQLPSQPQQPMFRF